MTAANAVTLFRIGLVPVFVILYLYAPGTPALTWAPLAVFTLAAALDAVDGAIARIMNQRTELGAFLDPLADKLLIAAIYLISLGQGVPAWLVVIVISRDVLIVLGWGALRIFEQDTRIAPLMASKVNTAVQFVTAILILLNTTLKTGGYEAISPQIMAWAYALTVFTTLGSGMMYMISWLKKMGGARHG